MQIKVQQHGLSTTIQDLGRPGYFHLGIPLSGAMDRYSLRVANMLVGNSEDCACLEAVFIGPRLEFMADSHIAVTGADMPVLIDGVKHPSWTCLPIKKGQVLSFGFLSKGARIYIAIAGGIDTPKTLGSRSTYLVGALGGLDGKAIANNDIIPIGTAQANCKEGASLAIEDRRPTLNDDKTSDNSNKIRVLTGLFWEKLTQEAQINFFDDQWFVGTEADRMGYRFKGGRKITFIEMKQPFGAGPDPSNIVDGPYPYGSIQIPGGSEPIILHRDAVSAGGYLTCGTVISADMDIIGQMQPNTKVKFENVDMDEALAARLARQNLLQKAREKLL